MSPSPSYQDLAQAYAAGVRALLAGGPPAGESTRGEVAATAIAGQAEALAALSAQLTQAAAARLAARDPSERMDVSSHLLAKALADVQVSAYLLQVAQSEEASAAQTRGAMSWSEGRGVTLPPLPEDLESLLGAAPAGETRSAEVSPADLAAGRAQLNGVADEALQSISARAARSGQGALSGVLVLGAGQIAQAAGIVGLDIAQALGYGDKVTHLYTLLKEFALNAYDSILALLGPAIAQMAANEVVSWVNQVAQGQEFAKLLEKLYATAQTQAYLTEFIDNSEAPLAQFAAAIQAVDSINGKYQQQMALLDKLLVGLQLLSGVPVAVLPQGKLFLTAVLITVGAYAVLAGGDCVDAQRLRWLNRVPGVRDVVEWNLRAG